MEIHPTPLLSDIIVFCDEQQKHVGGFSLSNGIPLNNKIHKTL